MFFVKAEASVIENERKGQEKEPFFRCNDIRYMDQQQQKKTKQMDN